VSFKWIRNRVVAGFEECGYMLATEKACALGKVVEFVREDVAQALGEDERELVLLAFRCLLGAADATDGGALLSVQSNKCTKTVIGLLSTFR
jgi:hypothetical protein